MFTHPYPRILRLRHDKSCGFQPLLLLGLGVLLVVGCAPPQGQGRPIPLSQPQAVVQQRQAAGASTQQGASDRAQKPPPGEVPGQESLSRNNDHAVRGLAPQGDADVRVVHSQAGAIPMDQTLAAALLAGDWVAVKEWLGQWPEEQATSSLHQWLQGVAACETGAWATCLGQPTRLADGDGSVTDSVLGLATRHPENAPVHLLAAMALAHARKDTEALAEVEHAMALGANTAAAHALHGSILALLGRNLEAQAVYSHALGSDPARVDALLGRAVMQLRHAVLAAAREDVEQALTVAPGVHAILNMRGLIHYANGDTAAAIRDFRDAAAGGGATAARNNLAVALRTLSQGHKVALQEEGMHLHTITVVVADPKQMPTAMQFAGEMVRARTGQPAVMAKTPQEALAQARSQPVLLASPVVVGNPETVLGYAVQRDLQGLGSRGSVSVNVVALNGAAAEGGLKGVQRYLETPHRGSPLQITSVQLLTPSQPSPGILTPHEVTNLRAVMQTAGAVHSKGVPIAIYETQGQPGNVRNVAIVRQDPRFDLYVTPYRGGDTTISLGLPSRDRPLPLTFSLRGSSDSASSRAVLERDWFARRGGNEYPMRVPLTELGKEYIGGVRPQPQPVIRPEGGVRFRDELNVERPWLAGEPPHWQVSVPNLPSRTWAIAVLRSPRDQE